MKTSGLGVALSAVILGQATFNASAAELLTADKLHSILTTNGKPLADMIFGKSISAPVANNMGTGGPCPQRQIVGLARDFYCVKVTIEKEPIFSPREINNNQRGNASLEAAKVDSANAVKAFNDSKAFAVKSLADSILQAWQDNRSALDAVQERVNGIEAGLPANIDKYCTPKLLERVAALEERIAELEANRTK